MLAGAIGVMTDAYGPPIIQWQQTFNAWDLLAHELKAACDCLHLVADINVSLPFSRWSNAALLYSFAHIIPCPPPLAYGFCDSFIN